MKTTYKLAALSLVCIILSGCAGTYSPVSGSVHYCESGWGKVEEDNSVTKRKSYIVCTKQVNNVNVFRKGSSETQWLVRAN